MKKGYTILEEAARLTSLESEINDVLNRRTQPPSLPVPTLIEQPELPHYVDHAEGINKIGKLTAAAVIRDYEETAKRFNAMGEELKRVAEQCERYVGELHTMITHVDEVATRYRERGTEIFRWLEQSARTTEEARNSTDEMAAKISGTIIAAS